MDINFFLSKLKLIFAMRWVKISSEKNQINFILQIFLYLQKSSPQSVLCSQYEQKFPCVSFTLRLIIEIDRMCMCEGFKFILHTLSFFPIYIYNKQQQFHKKCRKT